MRILFLLSLLFAPQAWAYPEMARHGYSSCVACHVSPTGGGALTAYGNALAKELLSYKWKAKTDEPTAEEEEDLPRKIHFGGEIRFLNLYLNNEHETVNQTIPMQVHGDALYNDEAYAANLRLGLVAKPDGGSGGAEGEEEGGGDGSGDGFSGQISTAYVMRRWINDESSSIWHIRAGRFLPGYGLNNSMHFLGTRGGLGFGFKDQRTGLEISRLAETWGAFFALFGPRDNSQGDTSRFFQVQYSPTDKSKISFNFWNESQMRDVFGIWGTTSLVGPTYLSFDLNQQKETNLKVTGQYYFLQLGYEIAQGLQLRMLWDHQQRDETRSYTKIVRYGPSLQFFPMRYMDIELTWLKEQNQLFNSGRGDYAYILLHGYY